MLEKLQASFPPSLPEHLQNVRRWRTHVESFSKTDANSWDDVGQKTDASVEDLAVTFFGSAKRAKAGVVRYSAKVPVVSCCGIAFAGQSCVC